MENLIGKDWSMESARIGTFHIKCLEDILDLSSPAILPHIVHSLVGSKGYMLDIGAAEIVKLWYEKCNMDNMVATAINATTDTVSEVVGTSDEGISSTEPIADTSSSASAPAPSTSSSFQWQGHDLVYLPDLEEKGSVGVESYSWHHDRDALFVPWSEDIVTDKLPRLPSNGGFILKDDLVKHFDELPLQLPGGAQWSILSYLPHEPSEWGAKHALSESLERWWKHRVRGPLTFFGIWYIADHPNIQNPKHFWTGPEGRGRGWRLGPNVHKRITKLSKKVQVHTEATSQPSEDPSQE